MKSKQTRFGKKTKRFIPEVNVKIHLSYANVAKYKGDRYKCHICNAFNCEQRIIPGVQLCIPE